MDNFMDTLLTLSEKKGSKVILEISPDAENIPDFLKEKYQSAGAVLFAYCKGILDSTAEKLPAVIINKSAFELYGPGGIMAMDLVAKYAHQKGVIAIIDGTFGGTGEAMDNYIDAYLGTDGVTENDFFADAITISPYSNAAAIKNAAAYVQTSGKALFMVVRTTKSSDKTHFENVETKEDEEALYCSAIDDAAAFSENYIGEKGYGNIGLLTYATAKKEAVKLRQMDRWGLFLTRIDLSELDNADFYGFFYPGEGEGQMMVLGDDVVYAYKSDLNFAPETFGEACRAALDSAISIVSKNIRG